MELFTSPSVRGRIARASAAFIVFGAIASLLLPADGVTSIATASSCSDGTLCDNGQGVYESGVCDVNGTSCTDQLAPGLTVGGEYEDGLCIPGL